ncbi:CDP-glycerol glycerophosphotransferase family protein [Thalassotalea fonticola]|uniref:CDP-glycerol glycerophosphotransferase family protein n=1 Tax=Thalassotalea fonticola TaxID=3065649 RepID=A0ABZ0GUZ3_9GAMM|nr:CDP-glycerol glycerophosphotransferase family protein [Colwelliaceae bacterium S1-1]
MFDCKVAYYVNDNIQHFPPVHRLQTKLPGPIIVRGKKILGYIQENYPEIAKRTFFIRNRRKAKKFLKQHQMRVVVYPAFQTLNFGLSVEIFHGGLSDKRYLENAFISMYDLVLFPGEKSRDKVEKAGLLTHVVESEVIGYPKFDPLINDSLSYEPLFNNGKPTVLYAPTWISMAKEGATAHRFSKYGESSLPLWGVKLLKYMPESVNFIVKFHALVHEDGNSINKQMENYVTEHGLQDRIKILYADNILQYMDQADVMISDISSACYEWFHFNRPIIYANPDPVHYQPSDDISSNTFAWQAGDVINKDDDIAKFINSNLAADNHKEKRNNIFHYSIYKPDGYATDRQADTITKLLSKNEDIPYHKFSRICALKHFWRNLKMQLVLKRKVDKLEGL